MRKLLVSAVVSAAMVIFAANANASQGGFDHSGEPHAWIKVGYHEMNIHPNNHGGYDSNYRGGCPGVSDHHQCDMLSEGLNREFLAAPGKVVSGYWAEYYTSGNLRSGTW